MRLLSQSHLRPALEGGHHLHDIIKLAQTAPGAFLDEVWPWFVDVLGDLVSPDNPSLCTYRDDSVIHTQRQGEDGPIDELPEALRIAVEGLARQDGKLFLAFVKQWQSNDFLAIHVLLTGGLKVVAPSRAREVLEYLTDDPRRLVLGDYEDPIYATCELIDALAPHLDLNEERQLEDAILQSYHYVEGVKTDDAKWRFQNQRYNRLHRLCLFRTIEKSAYLSPRAHALIDEESRALADLDDRTWTMHNLVVFQGPMRSTQMRKASDHDILNRIHALPDSTELAEFAKAEPDRALHIISYLQPGTHERPAACVVEALAESDVKRPVEEIEALILHLEERGFASNEYRERVAWALSKLAERGAGLSARSCELLHGWLVDSPEEHEVERVESSKRPRSILWGWGGGGVLPHGNFPVLQALFFGYGRRQPADFEPLLGVFESHVARKERVGVWRALLRYLRYIHRSEHLQSFVARLFAKYPGVRDYIDGARLVAQMCSWVDGDLMRAWLHGIRDSQWSDGAQVYGELLMLLSVRRAELAWVTEELDAALRSDVEMNPQADGIRLGLAYAAVRLWWEPEDRSMSTAVFLRLLPGANGDLATAMMQVFSSSRAMPADDDTTQVLDGILVHRSVLIAGDPRAIGLRLKDMCAEDPHRTSKLCNVLLDEFGRTENSAARLAMAGANLIDIAVTLQRLHDYREEGMDLFERLLVMDLYGTHDTLRELDIRPH